MDYGPVNLTDDDLVVIDDSEIVFIDPSRLTDAAPPVPALSPTHYDALRRSMKESGQQQPVLATPDGTVHDGRQRRKICQEMGMDVAVRYISYAAAATCWFATCCQREWHVHDKARLIDHVVKSKLYETEPFMVGKDEREEDRIARYLKNTFGWVRDVNTGKQVQRFRTLFDHMQKATEDQISAVSKCGNVNAGLAIFRDQEKEGSSYVKSRLKLAKALVKAFLENPGIDDSEVEIIKSVRNMAEKALASHLSVVALLAETPGVNEGQAEA